MDVPSAKWEPVWFEADVYRSAFTKDSDFREEESTKIITLWPRHHRGFIKPLLTQAQHSEIKRGQKWVLTEAQRAKWKIIRFLWLRLTGQRSVHISCSIALFRGICRDVASIIIINSRGWKTQTFFSRFDFQHERLLQIPPPKKRLNSVITKP